MAQADKTLGATHSAMIFVQTLGAFTREKPLPAPKVFAAIWVVWGVLGFVAQLGPRAAHAAAQFSLLVLLTGALLGPFGKRAIGFLNFVGSSYATPPPAGPPTFGPEPVDAGSEATP